MIKKKGKEGGQERRGRLDYKTNTWKALKKWLISKKEEDRKLLIKKERKKLKDIIEKKKEKEKVKKWKKV